MKTLLNILKYLVLLALSGALMWYALKELDFARLWTELRAARWGWVGLSILITIPGFFSRAWRWRMQLHAARQPAGFWDTYHAMMTGYLANLVLPRAGEVVRCTILARTADVPVKVSLGSVIAERVIDLVMLVLFLGLLLLLEFNRLKAFFTGLLHDRYDSLAAHRTIVLLTGALVLAGGSLIVIFLWRNLDKLRPNRHFQKVSGFLRGLVEGLLSVGRLQNPWSFWAHTLFVWGTYYFTAVALFPSLNATAGLGLNVALALLVIGGLGMAAPVQGGIGVFHLFVQSTLIAYGLNKEQGMAYALISHTTQTVLVVVMGGISFVAAMLKTARRRREGLLTVENISTYELPVPEARN